MSENVPAQHRERLSRLPVLLHADYEVSVLGGGLTNTNLLVEVVSPGSTTDSASLPPGRYVARCSNGGEEVLGIDREAEHHNTAAAADAGVGAPTHAFFPDEKVLIVGFVDGETLTNEALALAGDDPVIDRMADAMRRLHAAAPFMGEFNMFTRQAGYLASVIERGFPLPENYLDFAAQWAAVRSVLEPRRTVLAPCNNDLLAGNFIDNGTSICLIDYEYSGMNEPTFELGNTATECDLTPTQIERLVEAYFGGATDAQHAAVWLQALCSEYGWSLWGFIQAETSPLDFDFYGWGMERFTKAATRFESSEFAELMGMLR